MANMIPISTVTVGSGGASSIDFVNIPQNYTDLVIKVSARNVSGSADGLYLTLNGSTSSFTYRDLYANGTGASSSSGSLRIAGYSDGANMTASTFANSEIYIPNYSGSNYKSISTDGTTENNATLSYSALVATLWSNTSPITSISITSGVNLAQYSSATLYGIRKY